MDTDFDEIGAVWRRIGAGERREQPFQLSFNSWLRVDFQGSRVSSDAGMLLVRELDERLGFGDLIEQHLADGRGKNTQLPLTDPCGSRYTADWRGTKTLTMPNGCPKIRPSGSSAPGRSGSAARL